MFLGLRLAAGTAVAALAALPFAPAKSGVVHLQDRSNPQHISGLPAEIQSAIARYARLCGGPLAAEHPFANYFQRGTTKLIVLHFEYLRCPNRDAICRATGCLHQVYVSSDGRYRFWRSSYVLELDVTEENIAPSR